MKVHEKTTTKQDHSNPLEVNPLFVRIKENIKEQTKTKSTNENMYRNKKLRRKLRLFQGGRESEVAVAGKPGDPEGPIY